MGPLLPTFVTKLGSWLETPTSDFGTIIRSLSLMLKDFYFHRRARLFQATTISLAIFVVLVLSNRECFVQSVTRIPRRDPHDVPYNSVTPSLEIISSYFTDYPLDNVEFGKLGRRARILGEWIATSDRMQGDIDFRPAIETLASTVFPFLSPLGGPGIQLSTLRSRHRAGSRGIVIPVGKTTFRFACHLIVSIRNVLGSNLPIEIAHSGERDLPFQYRRFLTSLGPEIRTVDVTRVFNHTSLGLIDGKWAIKPFAVLASRFEKVALLDADSVMLQQPEVLFNRHPGFNAHGVLLFRDRLIFKDAYPERHAWWGEQMKHALPSSNYLRSRVHIERYSEEGESGLVVVDKSRLPVFLGLLHVAWQNSKEIREQVTYRMGYGDKETWWLAFELCNVPYAIEHRYAAIMGEIVQNANTPRVCSFTIAHVDENDHPLWLNGGLLKNKAQNPTEFWVPDAWMLDGEWEKGITKSTWSCKKGGQILAVDEGISFVLNRSVDQARIVDRMIRRFAGNF